MVVELNCLNAQSHPLRFSYIGLVSVEELLANCFDRIYVPLRPDLKQSWQQLESATQTRQPPKEGRLLLGSRTLSSGDIVFVSCVCFFCHIRFLRELTKVEGFRGLLIVRHPFDR